MDIIKIVILGPVGRKNDALHFVNKLQVVYLALLKLHYTMG